MTGAGHAASSRKLFARGLRSSAASTVGGFTITRGILAVDERTIGKKEKVTPFNLIPWTGTDRKSTRLNSSHSQISYAVFCLKKKKNITHSRPVRPALVLLSDRQALTCHSQRARTKSPSTQTCTP